MLSASHLLSLATFVAAASRAGAFTFSYGSPTQCDNLNVTWTGGTAPFQLLITPSYGTPKNVTIPSTAYTNGKGAYSLPMPFLENTKVLLTMSDGTGFNTGGTSNFLTIGKSQGGSCNTTDVGTDFFFQMNSALAQCRSFVFEGYDAAVQPVTILGFIPGGDIIRLNPPSGPKSYDWTCNAPAGTDIIFAMIDSKGHQGGSAEVRTVGQSGTSDCLNNSSPQSTANAPTSTSTAQPSASSSAGPADGDKDGPSTAVIVGAVLGALLGIACASSLALFFLRRRRARQNWSPAITRHSRLVQSVDLLHPGPGASAQGGGERAMSPFDDPQGAHLPPGHQPEPYMLTTPTSEDPYADDAVAPADASAAWVGQAHAHRPSVVSTTTPSSAARRKAAMAGMPAYQQPSRFILHTDIEEAQPNADGFIELPPQYSASRAPLSDAGATPSVSSHISPSVDPFGTPSPSRHPSDAPLPEGHPTNNSDSRLL